jgi:hypothetical protein
LLSEETFMYRINQLLSERLVDPGRLIGDLGFRASPGWRERIVAALATLTRPFTTERAVAAVRDEILLGLDWTGATAELLLGRHHACDVVLDDPTVSRRHTRLLFRDGTWVLQDLESTNGTIVNGVRVGRCALRPGDHLLLGEARLRID